MSDRHGVCSNAEKLREKIPDVEKNLEKSQNELADMITQENKATNEVLVTSLPVTASLSVLYCCKCTWLVAAA